MTISTKYKYGIINYMNKNLDNYDSTGTKVTDASAREGLRAGRMSVLNSGNPITLTKAQAINAYNNYGVPKEELWPDGKYPPELNAKKAKVSQATIPLPKYTKLLPPPPPASKDKADVPISTLNKVELEPDTPQKVSNLSYHLMWKTALIGKTEKQDIDISRVSSKKSQDAMLDTLLNRALTTNISIPLNSSIALTQEYTPSVQNKIVQFTTLAGNSTTTFGQGPKKISMKISIIKAGRLWVAFQSALEALHYISGNPGRYFGNIYLYGFDSNSTNLIPRKYKVTMESLSFSMRSDRNNIIDADITFIVNHDYSIRPLQSSGQWGRL